MNLHEARQQFQADRPHLAARGMVLENVVSYIPDGWKEDFNMAMDAQPALVTTSNSGIPSMLSTYIDPGIIEILFAANKAAEILGEAKKGDWTTDTAMFPVVEHTGEVTSYGDYATSGSTGVNTNFPQRQAYLFQTIKQYGQRELERAGLARISWVAELDSAAALAMNKFSNYSYFFGIANLQNYGLLNDPSLSAALTPAPKTYGNNRWITNGVITATANEIYTDIQSLLLQLITQSSGLITQDSQLVLALSPQSKFALTATNSFNVNVEKLLKDNIPNLKVIDAVQYGALSAQNPQGIAAGEFVQMIAPRIEGQQTGYCAFNEKMRSHPLIQDMSAWKQKMTGGTWGAIILMPLGFASMVGV